MAVKVLPPSVFGAGPLKWIYLALTVLMAAAMVDMYVPLFGQRLAHLVPVAAGFLGAALAVGWAVSEILSASLSSKRIINRVVVGAPVLIAVGLILAAATQVDNAATGLVATWALALTITGVGIGAAWPHLSAWSMQFVDDEKEGAAAAAAINTIEVIAGAFGAGLAGVVVNTAHGSMVIAARALFAVFAVVGVLGALAATGHPEHAMTSFVRIRLLPSRARLGIEYRRDTVDGANTCAALPATCPGVMLRLSGGRVSGST